MDFVFLVSIPPVTRSLLLLGACSVVLISIGLVHPVQMVFSPTLAFQEKQYWRLFSTFLYFGGVNLNSIIELHWLYVVSGSIELQYFRQRKVDYCLTILTGAALLLALRTFRVFETPYLSFLLSKSLIYLFGRLLPDQEVSIFGLVAIQVRFLPLLFLLITIALEETISIRSDLVANLVGHVLWYLLEIFPRITTIHPLRVQEYFVR